MPCPTPNCVSIAPNDRNRPEGMLAFILEHLEGVIIIALVLALVLLVITTARPKRDG